MSALTGLRAWQTLCFSSDYPHWDFDEPALTLRALPKEWRSPIASENAAAFYRLSLPVAVES